VNTKGSTKPTSNLLQQQCLIHAWTHNTHSLSDSLRAQWIAVNIDQLCLALMTKNLLHHSSQITQNYQHGLTDERIIWAAKKSKNCLDTWPRSLQCQTKQQAPKQRLFLQTALS